MDTLKIDHLVAISNAKTVKIEEDRATQVERANRILFEKIEGIINRQGPYKLQPSKNNSKKQAKIFHAPSDNLVTASTYFPRQTYNMTQVKKDQRDAANRKLQEENMKVLDRIMAAKPTVRLEALLKHEKMYKKLKKNHNVGSIEQTKHGYPARGVQQFSVPRTESIMNSSRRGDIDSGSVMLKKLNEQSSPTEEDSLTERN
jgi:hypothetical protein